MSGTDNSSRSDEVALIEILRMDRSWVTLWFEGEPDVLLAKGEAVVAFPTVSDLFASLREDSCLSPAEVISARRAAVGDALQSKPLRVDPEGARAWFTHESRATSRSECELVLDTMNLLGDVAATVGDTQLVEELASDPVREILDRITMMLTFLGKDVGSQDDPVSIGRLVDSRVAAAAVSLIDRTEAHIAFLH